MAATHPVNTFAHLVLIAFAPAASLLFRVLSLQWAVSITVTAGFLFLPILEIPVKGLPDYTKSIAISAAIIMGFAVRGKKLPRIPKIRWWDIAFTAWIFALPIAYILNNYPIYSAASALFANVMLWAVPYWTGRTCFKSAESAKILLNCIVIAGLAYVPLAAWEVRMSPQLHTQVYGEFQHSFGQMMRGDGFRPIVFTEHALVLALWFGTVLIAATSLRQLGKNAPRWSHKAWWLMPVFILMIPMCKSLGATVLGFTATASVALRSCRYALLIFILAAMSYVMARIFFDEGTYQAISSLLDYLPPERAQSFQFRMDNERLLLARAWDQPWIGWVKEGFRNVATEGLLPGEASVNVVTDSMWIIVFGTTGFMGIFTLYPALIAGATRCYWDASVRQLTECKALSAIVAILMLDTVSNGWFGPVATLATGAALSVGAAKEPKPNANSSPKKNPTNPLRPRASKQAALGRRSHDLPTTNLAGPGRISPP